jgi:orotate phosphoribosyltransferase
MLFAVTILDIYRDTGGYLEGHFLLASGRHSPKFLQSTTVLQHPQHALALGKALAKKLELLKPDFVIGPAMGGVIVAFSVAASLGCRALFAEKDGKGSMKLREAFKVKTGERFVAVEDVITTGGSLKKAIAATEVFGAECIGIGCIIDRGLATLPKLPFFALDKVEFPTFAPEDCPLCREGVGLEEV